MLPPIRGSHPYQRGAARRAGAGGFALPESGPQALAVAGAATSAAGLLGLQDSWSPAERDAAALRRGDAVLDALAELQLAQLSGGIAPERLSRLAALAEGEAGADPGLREIMDGLSLRVRVELARRGS